MKRVLLVCLLSLAAVAAPLSAADAPAPNDAPEAPELVPYFIGFYKRGPKWTAEASPAWEAMQKGHRAHILATLSSGKIIVAGPVADGEDIRGLMIFKVGSAEEAKALLDADPAVKAGHLVREVYTWMVPKGRLP